MSVGNRILVVDDDLNLLNGIRRYFGTRFNISVAQNGDEALAMVTDHGPYSVVICDMRMPGLSGIEVLERVTALAPDTVRLMLTGNADQKTAIDAINRGKVYKFFNKPCAPSNLAAGIEDALALYHRTIAEREILETTVAGSIRMVSDLLALADPVSFKSTTKIANWAGRIARAMGIANTWQVETAAGLSSLGLISVPPEVLARQRAGEKLTATEADIVARAPEVARNILCNIPRLEPIAEIVYYQDKYFNGMGFPGDAKAGPDLPVGARIIHVLKALAALSDLPPTKDQFEFLGRESGRFDPEVLRAGKTCLIGKVEGHFEQPTSVLLDVPVSALRAGDELVSNLELDSGHLILAKDSRLTIALLSRVHNLRRIHSFNEPIRIRRAV